MAGISSRALKPNYAENKYKFNGIEQNNDFDLNMYDAFYRNLDPQMGRWWEVDPKVDDFYEWTPYNLNFENPVRFADPLGDNPVVPILRRLGKKGVQWAMRTVKGQIKPITREQALSKLKKGETVYSTQGNSAKNAKKLMKEAAGNKPIVRHDGHTLPNGKKGFDHYQKKVGDGSHVNYVAAVIVTPGTIQIPESGDDAATTATKAVANNISVVLNPAGAILDVVGKTTGANKIGKAVFGDNKFGRFVDDWINPFN